MFRVLRSLASENPQVTCLPSFSPLRLRPHAWVGVAPKRRVRRRSQRNDRIEPASRPPRSRPRTRSQRLPPDGPAGAISGWSDEALVLLGRRCFPCRDRRESKIDRTDGRGPILAPYSAQSVAGQFCYSEPDLQVTPSPSRFIRWRCIGPARSTVASAVHPQRSCPGEEIRFGSLRERRCVFSRRRSRLPRSEGDPTRACA